MTYRSVSLKVCEGCGTLWIRGGLGTGVYCGPCTQILQQFPDPKTRLRPGRPTKRHVERSYGNAAVVAGGEEQQILRCAQDDTFTGNRENAQAQRWAQDNASFDYGEEQQAVRFAQDEAFSTQEDGLWEGDEGCGFAGNPAVLVGSSAAVTAGGAA